MKLSKYLVTVHRTDQLRNVCSMYQFWFIFSLFSVILKTITLNGGSVLGMKGVSFFSTALVETFFAPINI
jgi:hypothetical protein